MGLINQDNRTKQDLTHTRTPEDVMRRLAKNVQITSDEVKGLTVEVKGKVDGKDIISTINQSAEAVTIDASKVNLNGYVTVSDLSGSGTTTINGSNITTGTISANRVTGGTLEGSNIKCGSNFYVDTTGKATAKDLDVTGGSMVLTRDSTVGGAPLTINHTYNNVLYTATMGAGALHFKTAGVTRASFSAGTTSARLYMYGSDGVLRIQGDASNGNITCVSLTQTSKEEEKKNFKKLENALDIVKDVDIYKYNMKDEKETDKKHIGFVIGDKFNYRKEITSSENDGVDTYSMVSVLWKAVQEQQKEIEELKKVIK